MKEGGRSESDKERTKLRERQRRGITTKIFNGLRKHGGYELSPRADINEVLRELAKEAGWVVDPDGTTYRSFDMSKDMNRCSVCGVAKTSATTTPSSSIVIGGSSDDAGGGVGKGGEGSTTVSPRRIQICERAMNVTNTDMFLSSGLTDIPPELYVYAGLAGGSQLTSAACSMGDLSVAIVNDYQQQSQMQYLPETNASNQNTPAGSPRRRFTN